MLKLRPFSFIFDIYYLHKLMKNNNEKEVGI